MNNFWSSFAKATEDKTKFKNSRKKAVQAIYALAPMAGYTDSAFRQICRQFGADVVYSEMASATALIYNPKKTLEMLKFSETERPYVVQLFGANPDHFAKAVKVVERKIKPDGIDINFGCPVKKVMKQGAGAVLMDNLKLAHQIIKTATDNTSLPVSIKIRSKASRIDALKFLDHIKDLSVKAIMIHGRSLGQGFSGPIDWQIIKELRKYFKGILLANGGIKSAEDALELLEKTRADGVGIGRGALGSPWIFQNVKTQMSDVKTKTEQEIIMIILKHAELVNKLKGEQGIREMRKHLCWYVRGLPEAKKLRQKLVMVETLDVVKKILN